MMHLAAAGGHVEVLKILTSQNARHVRFKNLNEETPLHLAAKNGHRAAVEYLMKYYATSCKEEEDDLELWSLSLKPTVTYLDAAIKGGHRYGKH